VTSVDIFEALRCALRGLEGQETNFPVSVQVKVFVAKGREAFVAQCLAGAGARLALQAGNCKSTVEYNAGSREVTFTMVAP
jgi:hypothetical protein